jgi:hypothetical protein
LFGGGRLVGVGWTAGGVPRIVRGDFTGDGRSDIVAQYPNGELRAWASTGDTSADARLFTGPGTPVGVGWTTAGVPRIVVGDFTGDGKDDLGANYSNGDLRLWVGTGDLSAPNKLFAGGRLVGVGWTTGGVPRIVVGDFTGDGKTDIAANYGNGELRAWASTGDVSADTRLFTGNGTPVGTGWTTAGVPRIAVGDFTGDGKDDLGANYGNGDLRLWAGTGDLSAPNQLFAGGRLVGVGWSTGGVPRIVVGDFTGDGKTDIAANYGDGTINTWASTGDTSADNRLFGNTQANGIGWTLTAVPRIT